MQQALASESMRRRPLVAGRGINGLSFGGDIGSFAYTM